MILSVLMSSYALCRLLRTLQRLSQVFTFQSIFFPKSRQYIATSKKSPVCSIARKRDSADVHDQTALFSNRKHRLILFSNRTGAHLKVELFQ